MSQQTDESNSSISLSSVNVQDELDHHMFISFLLAEKLVLMSYKSAAIQKKPQQKK